MASRCILLALLCGTYGKRIGNHIEPGTLSARLYRRARSDGHRRLAESGPVAHSVYNFGDRWANLSFNDRWAEFLNAVPLEKFQTSSLTGPVCVPSLQGSQDSPHLVILLHGFTACPGMWDLVKPDLISANVLSQDGKSSGHGFRVMTPTLPGHGRRYSQNDTDVMLVQEFGVGPDGQHHTSNQDDLSDMPNDPTPYFEFSESLGLLAERFKQEHPEGTIALVGHSLGGLIAAKVAMDRPRVFDRVMLMNPSFIQGNFVDRVSHLLPFLRHSWADCDQHRGKNSGGYCQFFLSNIRAFVDFFADLNCNEWGIIPCLSSILRPNSKRSTLAVRQAFHDLQSFQVVMTASDPAVDNNAISRFLDKVTKWRAPGGAATVASCKWPSEFTHNYIHPRDLPKTKDIWWTKYLNAKLEAFLVRGELIPVVDRRGSPKGWPSAQRNVCLPPSKLSLDGEHLTFLPAEQLPAYSVVDANGNLNVLDVIFHGKVFKESEHLHRMKVREVELMRAGQSVIVTTRRERHGSIHGLYVVKLVSRSRFYFHQPCVQLTLARLSEHDQLFAQLLTTENNTYIYTSKFCDKSFMNALCAEMNCFEQGTLVSQQPSGFAISTNDIGARVAQPIFHGIVLNVREHLHRMHTRETEVLRIGNDTLLLTRKSPRTEMKDCFMIDSNGVTRNGSCVSLILHPLKSGASLRDEVSKAHDHIHQRTRLKFCADDFVAAICPILGCRISSQSLYDQAEPATTGRRRRRAEDVEVKMLGRRRRGEDVVALTQENQNALSVDSWRLEQ